MREAGADPWDDVRSQFSGLGRRIKDTYRQAGEGGPSEDEIKGAFATLLGAWNQVADSISTALRDPETRDRLKDAAGAFATAVGSTLSGLGNEIRDDLGREEE